MEDPIYHSDLESIIPQGACTLQYPNNNNTAVMKPLSVQNRLGHMRGAHEDRPVLPPTLLLSFSTYEMKRNGTFVGYQHLF